MPYAQKLPNMPQESLSSVQNDGNKAFSWFKAALDGSWGLYLKSAWIWISLSYHQNGFENQSLILQWAS